MVLKCHLTQNVLFSVNIQETISKHIYFYANWWVESENRDNYTNYV